MKELRRRTRLMSGFLALIVLLASCASSTMITTDKPGADVYLNEEYVGQTPYLMRDTKIVGSCTSVRLEAEGYETMYTSICKNEEAHVGAIIGGIFFLVPFLWTMKYKATHSYKLKPSETEEEAD